MGTRLVKRVVSVAGSAKQQLPSQTFRLRKHEKLILPSIARQEMWYIN